ncbi:hypothetical protein [Aquisphaera insulae]|uniref:hypothetical protein n=1 Tax=Aquisphaera insulae TaxID=2712864 RepID=UPI0013EDAEBC|nr:hypothetical protein [Aquisphaera insulae]
MLDGLALAYGQNQDQLSQQLLPFSIYDSHDYVSGHGLPAEATDLSSVSYYLDGVLQGKLDVGQGDFARSDVFIATPELTSGQTVSATLPGNQIFDLLLYDSIGGWGLALNSDTWKLTYDSSTNQIVGDASAIVCPTCTPNQKNPFDLYFDPAAPIDVHFAVTQVSGGTDPGQAPMYFLGSATIIGTARGADVIPEPPSAVLTLVAAGGLLGGLRFGRSVRRGVS